jgi:hypothetical protein
LEEEEDVAEVDVATELRFEEVLKSQQAIFHSILLFEIIFKKLYFSSESSVVNGLIKFE